MSKFKKDCNPFYVDKPFFGGNAPVRISPNKNKYSAHQKNLKFAIDTNSKYMI